jgi:uncharacterized membrane protein YccC
VFTSSYVLLMFHLLAPGSMRIIGERAIDTVLGCAIAVTASHLFPYWEYRLMGKLVNGLIAATRQYLEVCWHVGTNKAAVPASSDKAKAPVPLASCATAQPTAAASAAASVIDSDIRYRLARKNVHIAFANLGQAFQRMLLEPKSAQRYVAELNDLLVRTHALTAQITASAPLMMTLSQSPARTAGIVGTTRSWSADNAPTLDAQALAPLQQALATVRDNLVQAEAGVAPPPDQADIIKRLNRELDQMVVDAERAQSAPSDIAQELKGLAYQCKQMIVASFLIRKDASVIKLPA